MNQLVVRKWGLEKMEQLINLFLFVYLYIIARLLMYHSSYVVHCYVNIKCKIALFMFLSSKFRLSTSRRKPPPKLLPGEPNRLVRPDLRRRCADLGPTAAELSGVGAQRDGRGLWLRHPASQRDQHPPGRRVGDERRPSSAGHVDPPRHGGRGRSGGRESATRPGLAGGGGEERARHTYYPRG